MKFDYSNIAEKVYSRSFFAVCVFIIACLWIAYDQKEDIVEILKIVLAFVKYALALYVVPVSLQIAGEKAQVFFEWVIRNKGIKK